MFFTTKQLRWIIIKNSLKAAIVITVGVAAIIFFSRQITRLTTSIVAKKRLSLQLQQSSELSVQLKQDLTAFGDGDQKIVQALPPIDNILSFIGTLESVAFQHSLQQKAEFGTPVPWPNERGEVKLYTIEYSISLNGTIATLLDYLKDFQRLPYLTEITSVSLSAPATNGWDDATNISLRARLYAH